VYELEAENARHQKHEKAARKYEFRLTGVLLLVIGTAVVIVAYPSYNLSPIANVLMMVGVGALFLGAVTVSLNTETFMNQKVAERLNISSVAVIDDLLRDLRVRHKGVYIPSSRTGGPVKVFIPLKGDYTVPSRAHLVDDKAFLIGLPETSQEGVLLKPLGYHLFRYTNEDLKIDWAKAPGAPDSKDASTSEHERTLHPSFTEKLHEVLVKGLEIAAAVNIVESEHELEVRLTHTTYSGLCHALKEEAPQVCDQIGCPLCSVIACIYTEYADTEVVIERAHQENHDILITCKQHGGE